MAQKYNPIIQCAQFFVCEMAFAVNDFKDSIGAFQKWIKSV